MLAALPFTTTLLAANDVVVESVLEVFVRDGCPQFARAKVFFQDLPENGRGYGSFTVR